MEVPAKLVESVSTDPTPGAYGFYTGFSDSKILGMVFRCPCGCGSIGSLDFRNDNPDQHPSWTWDGNQEMPTLTPSVLKNSDCRWHGYLTAGVWESC